MAGNQQQAAKAPEDDWLPFIRSTYPRLLQESYFFPPLHFNRVPRTVQKIADQIACVTVNPAPPPPAGGRCRHQRRARQKSSPLPPQTSSASSPPSTQSSRPCSPVGTVFTEHPAGLQEKRFQDTDLRDDEAQHQCLQALKNIGEIMMVLSQMMFRKYLDNQHNPQQNVNPTNIIAQLPTVKDPFIPKNIADGECDIIVLHRQYGILVGEVKAVGGEFLFQQFPKEQERIIAKVALKALVQLDNQDTALKHLVHDMAGGHIRVTKTLLLPNITSAQLMAAANSSQQLQQDLCHCRQTQDLTQAVSQCLCSDHLQQPLTWWRALWTGGPDPSMSDIIYERLTARFCGPASTVDVPTAGHPCQVLRDLGQAVAETALRFSSLVLTPVQMDLLNRQPEPPYMYLQGPPGCGKTVVLFLKALQWARRGMNVVIVGEPRNVAVAILLEEQLGRILGTAAATGSVQRHLWDDRDVSHDVSRLAQLLGTCPHSATLILFDEAPDDNATFIQWLTDVRSQLPAVSVWAAGMFRWDNDPTCPLPPWLETQTLNDPLRCPPAVTRQVETCTYINGEIIPKYTSDPKRPLPTEGPQVCRRQHASQEAHRWWGAPWLCEMCADTIADIFRELHIGEPGYPRYRDTWILCPGFPTEQSAAVLVDRLSLHHGVPVREVPPSSSDDDVRDLALGVNDQVIVTASRQVQGLERSVVIALGYGEYLWAWSRCTSFLCIIQ